MVSKSMDLYSISENTCALCVTLIFTCYCLTVVNAGVCERTPQDTSALKTHGDNGFRIKLAGRPPPEKYTPNHVYTVSINGTYQNQRILDFMLVAVPLNARDESTSMGTFQFIDDGLTRTAENCPHVITQAVRHSRQGVNVLWTAPPPGSGCIEFRATVIEYPDIWYRDDGALTRVFCEERATTENDLSQELIPECCACGSPKYTLTFHGDWSRQTHPKDYPTHLRLLHWSNIVGATHTRDYMVWKYNDYATRGVKEVCEFGYTSTLEEEMRKQESDVRTVIKTSGIWWKDPEGLRQNRMAQFSVDRKRHLLSMLTMLGPSPDWCVGVSALDLCLPNCTWAGDKTIELFPWDAGTDDGLTYMAPNSPSDPQQRIHRITSNFPDNPTSPFFENDPLRPLARLELRRITPKNGEPLVCTNEEEEEEDEFDLGFGDDTLSDMEMKKKLMIMSGKCAVSDWSDWSGCSVTCGVGMRVRSRSFLMPGIDETMCPGLELMEKENCIGVENICEDPEAQCSVTEWSGWSPCSVTCGAGGVRERRRIYMRAESTLESLCQRQLRETEECALHDCQRATENAAAVCTGDADVGPCRGAFRRWYFDTQMHKCRPFVYGGCRGNENRFMTEEECQRLCLRVDQLAEMTTRQPPAIHENFQPRNGDNTTISVECMVTPWTPWSECSATCGKAWQTKERFIKREPTEDGKKCPKKLRRRKRCKLPRCSTSDATNRNAERTRDRSRHEERRRNRNKPQNKDEPAVNQPAPIIVQCEYIDWSEWSACSATCGEAFRKSRRRLVHGHVTKCTEPVERQQQCDDLPQCYAYLTGDCELGEWSGWSRCPPSTCIQERTRPVLRREERGGRPCGARIQRRVCVEGPCVVYSNSPYRYYT